jgi:hypothetical protein
MNLYIGYIMSSDKRDFTDFTAFPGELDEGTGYHVLPILWHKDDAGRWRQWQIFIRLVKEGDQLSGIDWDLLHETQVPIKSSYYEIGTSIPDHIHAEAWAETGVESGKITRNAPSYFTQPLNVGKINERNVLQNALVYARSQWLKRKEKGGSESKQIHSNSSSLVSSTMYFPMLAKPFKDGKKHLVFPLYIQPKLDGVRCLMFLKKKNGGVQNVVAYTRTKKPFPSVDYIKKTIYPYLNALYDEEKHQSIYFDGELYKHGKKLQDISGDSRNETADTSNSNTSRNEYHIYDCFYPKELDTCFKDRLAQLTLYYDAISKKDSAVLKKVPVYLVGSLKAAEKRYEQFVALGYEGAILRNADGVYLTSANKTGAFLRSNDLVKMKQKFADEYEVVGFTDGARGKDKGAIIWVCKTKDGVEFNVTPKDMTYERRYQLYDDAVANFDKKYANRMITLEYEDLSENGVPLRAKSVAFRDYE